MSIDLHKSAHYVTRLENCPAQCDGVDFAVMHTERLTKGCVGNKAYKLAPLFDSAPRRIMSFGGAWSNHLHALAYFCYIRGVECVGVVRRGESTDNLLLQSIKRYGMRLHFVSRTEYRRRDDPVYCDNLSRELGCSTWVPEGGADELAVSGCRRIGELINASHFKPDLVVLAVGTGATMAGVAKGVAATARVVGMPVIRDDKVDTRIRHWLASSETQWSLTEPLRPAYGKTDSKLLEFIVNFYHDHSILLDPVYTGKALLKLIRPEFPRSIGEASRVMFVHTGGLMGNYGFLDGYRNLSDQSKAALFLSALDRRCKEHFAGVVN